MDHHHMAAAAAVEDEVAPPGHAGQELDQANHSDHQQGAGSDVGQQEAAAAGSRRHSALSSASHLSSRRASRRTEALIHAAARDIVEHVGSRHHRQPDEEEEQQEEEHRQQEEEQEKQQEEKQEQQHQHPSASSAPADDAGDSSSHHEHEDDVFSDNSPRSSLGSMSEAEQTKIEQTLSQRNITQRVRSPRISDIPPSDHDDNFMATIRGNPRPPFRSPSSVRALQMASPPASSLGTPRSARRTPLPTVSRLASPSIMAQYSPKKTPPRFKRATPPLVLLHVTLLPLRWAWGGVVDGAPPAHLSPEAKTLREAWRQLQDRTGDTVSDRGILLPHPQNDYEVLEERLLEALELPLRRRARILECGHYLGPANEMALPDEQDSDDDEYAHGAPASRAGPDKAHWCRTCHSEIKYDSLGQAKVFRVKVYASNGLMRAGAWEACWKEMERVDVELEPIVDASLQDELALLSAEQERALETEQALADEQHEASETEYEEDDDEQVDGLEEHEESYLERAHDPELEHELCSSPPRPDEAPPNSSPAPMEHHRGDDDVERLREIYGSSPQPRREMTPARGRDSDLVPRETPPPSPSPEAFSQRQEVPQQAYKTASFLELVLEAGKVLLQDKKNVMIALLSALIVLLAFRGVRPAYDPAAYQPVLTHHHVRAMPHYAHDPVAEAPISHETATAATASPRSSPSSQSVAAMDPCASSLSSLEVVANQRVRNGAGDASPSTMRVFETWRVVETVTETARETLTETVSVSVSVAAAEAALETDALARWGP